ncbi:hypothetical protein ENBRE01_1533 [Enteropsectra breve]|nr:hypothetical protein ENBRE01_1533 [Enteropsectra breve]
MQLKWNNDQIIRLIELRSSREWEERFEEMKGRARQVGILWNSLSEEIGNDISGAEARIQYNYLLTQYKKHDLIARRSGESTVKWKYYAILKEHLFKNPTISPIAVVDNDGLLDEQVEHYDSSVVSCDSVQNVLTASGKASNKNKKDNGIMQMLASSFSERNHLIKSLIDNENINITKIEEDIVDLKKGLSSVNEKLDAVLKKLN